MAFYRMADGKENKVHGHNAAVLAVLHHFGAAAGSAAQIGEIENVAGAYSEQFVHDLQYNGP